MSTIIHTFHGVYLLQSTELSSKSYIGYTVDPHRRIRQHNRELKAAGAKKTGGKWAGTWKMLCFITGFTSNVQGLQFEWNWQYPHQSKNTKWLFPNDVPKYKKRQNNNVKSFKKYRRPRHKQLTTNQRIDLLNEMLTNCSPWNVMKLTLVILEPNIFLQVKNIENKTYIWNTYQEKIILKDGLGIINIVYRVKDEGKNQITSPIDLTNDIDSNTNTSDDDDHLFTGCVLSSANNNNTYSTPCRDRNNLSFTPSVVNSKILWSSCMIKNEKNFHLDQYKTINKSPLLAYSLPSLLLPSYPECVICNNQCLPPPIHNYGYLSAIACCHCYAVYHPSPCAVNSCQVKRQPGGLFILKIKCVLCNYENYWLDWLHVRVHE